MTEAPAAHAHKANQPPTSVKETVISLLIAFTIALIFRGIVLEPFQIPTGSMAPTLLGAHVRIRDRDTGYEWPISPSDFVDGNMENAQPRQQIATAREPNTDRLLPPFTKDSSSGDRIFVLKYDYPYGTPARWDVVVFRNPTNPQVYYIKRLVGLENEELSIVNGDVFVRPYKADRKETPEQCWESPEWKIARKPRRSQDATWQLIFDSTFEPANPVRDGKRWFTSPWLASTEKEKWKTNDTTVYKYEGSGPTSLNWDTKSRPIDDLNHYNDTPQLNARKNMPVQRYPVPDLRVSFGIKPAAANASAGATIKVNSHEFRGQVEGTKALVEMRPLGDPNAPWKVLGSKDGISPLGPDRVTNFEFRHVDQALAVLIDGVVACEGFYEWTPAQRVVYSTGKPLAAMLSLAVRPVPLSEPSNYTKPEVKIDISGAAELHRVRLDRDLFYQPVQHVMPQWRDTPCRGSHPTTLAIQHANEFFMMGDNSPASLDGRLWGEPDPWVSELIDPRPGVVPRDLIVGKAFCVFFPALSRKWGMIPIPDFGNVRWIW
ncbi:MAG: S26 family signal peptidase [Phycisphaerales bacterium]